MNKIGKNMLYEIIRSIALILIAAVVSGCTNSEESEQKNTRLQTELSRSNAHNVQLTSKIKKLEQKNKSLEKEISILRNKIKILSASLAKKYSTELESERKKLRNELETLEQDKQRVKKEAYKVAETNIKDKYFLILGALSILILILILTILFLYVPKNKKIKSEEEVEATGQTTFKIDGKRIKFYNSTGALKKNISIDEDIASGVQKGDEIHISTATGKIRVYTLRGSLKRTIDDDANTKYSDTSD